MIPADLERAREIVAARVVGKPDELPECIVFAVAQGIAEGRESGIQQGIKRGEKEIKLSGSLLKELFCS